MKFDNLNKFHLRLLCYTLAGVQFYEHNRSGTISWV